MLKSQRTDFETHCYDIAIFDDTIYQLEGNDDPEIGRSAVSVSNG